MIQMLSNGWLAPFLLQAQSGRSYWLPSQASTHASEVDRVFYFVYDIALFFFALIAILTVLFVIRYRRREGKGPESESSHNILIEITWTVIPTILVVLIFWSGFQSYMQAAVPPQNSYEILVTGQKWKWFFTYPNGHVDEDLHVPIDQPIKLTITSEDVIHSVFIPNFRLKMDAVPGRYTKAWFQATEAGEYDLFCAEYCGTQHSNMLATVVVHPVGEFETWLEDASNFIKNLPPAEAGEKLAKKNGCTQCHSSDGKAGIGPSFKDLYGAERPLADGTSILADDNYIRESILNPQAKVAAGFQPAMPTFKGKLKDEEITALIAYLKQLGGGQ